MRNDGRIETAREALKLFLKSLPLDSRFAIISFGSTWEPLRIDNKFIIKYNNENAKMAIDCVSRFSANFGGT